MEDNLLKIRRLVNKISFSSAIKKITNTPPAKYQFNSSVTILTMVSSETVFMYLLAIKSFLKYFPYGTVEVIDDGTLSSNDHELINYHVPDIRFSMAADVDTLSCPTYSSWKRLFRICEIARNSYVIQLDSDTLTMAPLIDVHNKVSSNEGFVIGNDRWSQPVDVEFLSKIVDTWRSDHVQPRAETILKDIEYFGDGTKYLRGCAGFAGYPLNFASKADIQMLSEQIEKKIGEKWHEWGSEQTATLCLISKTRGASVLPWPRYHNYRSPIKAKGGFSPALVHYIGSNRFDDAGYKRAAVYAIHQLNIG